MQRFEQEEEERRRQHQREIEKARSADDLRKRRQKELVELQQQAADAAARSADIAAATAPTAFRRHQHQHLPPISGSRRPRLSAPDVRKTAPSELLEHRRASSFPLTSRPCRRVVELPPL